MTTTVQHGSKRSRNWKITIVIGLLAALFFALAQLFSGANAATKAANDLWVTIKNIFGPEPQPQAFAPPGQYAAVGCGGSTPATVTFALPEHAYEIQHSCKWVDQSNLKAASCLPEVVGTTVRASGTIVGLDRDMIGNCKGGGHGTLTLSGSYKVKR